MLTQVCQYLRNWFERIKLFGDFVISSGQITYADGSALPLLDGQYFRVVGSVLNDGVHKTDDVLIDEEFSGAVWSMAIPPDFLSLVNDITEWVTNNAQAINSPYQSEGFAGYSYTLKSGGSGTDGSGSGFGWQSQFASRLGPWRKI
jgi:hypothetical protein